MCPRPSVEKKRREEILQASARCFCRKGYDACSMDEISAELPFSKGLIYYYFKSKREILLALLAEMVEQIYTGWDEVLSTEEDPLLRLNKIARSAMSLILRNQDLWRVEMEFWGQLARESDVLSAFREMFETLRRRLARVIEDGMERGQLRPVDAHALAAALVGAYDGLILQIVADRDAVDWQKASETLVESLLHGIQTNR